MRVTTLFRTADHLYWTKDPMYAVVRVGRNEAMTGERFRKLIKCVHTQHLFI